MTPSDFWPVALPWAVDAHAQTGLFTSLVLAQWADETEYGGPDWSPNNNPGNVGSFDGKPVARFPSLSAGVSAYIVLMNSSPQFGPSIRRGTTPAQQAYILGNAHPVWASAGYRLPGGAPGSALVNIIDTYNLTQYDAPAPPPPPPIVLPPQTQSPRGSDMLHSIPVPTDNNGNGFILTSIPWANFMAATLQGSDPAPTPYGDGFYLHGGVLVQDRDNCVLVSVSFAAPSSVVNVFVLATT